MNRMDQSKHKPLEFPKDREALVTRAFEASDGCVSVGGLAHRLGMLGVGDGRLPGREGGRPADFDPRRVALGKFVEFSRRRLGLSVEAFAEKTGLDLADVLQVEAEKAPPPEPRVVYALAAFLNADAAKLMELAGHTVSRDESLGREAVRFAAWSHGSEPLTREEERLLGEFARSVA